MSVKSVVITVSVVVILYVVVSIITMIVKYFFYNKRKKYKKFLKYETQLFNKLIKKPVINYITKGYEFL